MPIEVDEKRRLDEIAAATVEVARERGLRSVTIRAVAERLGGSTAMITNYVPSRAGLMVNALRHAEGEWRREAEELLEGVPDAERLPALVRRMCAGTSEDVVMRRLLMEIVSAGPAADGREVEEVAAMARAHRESLGGSVAAAGLPGREIAADVLHLVLRGYWLSTLEDPQGWPAERGTRAALAAVELLGGGDGAPTVPAPGGADPG
jgi:AcrR family transcriptional regulator